MFEIALPILALGIGFAAGYAVRDRIFRRRRAIARAEHWRRQEQELYDEGILRAPLPPVG